MEEIYTLVGKRIKEERKRLNITQEDLADKTNLSVAFIGQIERGVNRASLTTIEKVAQALEIPIANLFKNIPTKKTEYTITKQLESMLRDKSPKEQKLARELLRLVFSRKR